ncbi:MAG: response regulator [Terriglobales bacterium]
MRISVLLVEDHNIVREGLTMLLDRAGFLIAGEAGDGHTAITMAEQLQPDVVVLDIGLPLLNGLDAARAIRKLSPRSKIVFLSAHAERHYVVEGLRIGARAFVLKSQAGRELVQAVSAAARNRTHISPELAVHLAESFGDDGASDPLTPRERQVLQLVAEGNTCKEIASLLDISVKTAETHRASTMEKLRVHGTAGLVRYAIRCGMIQP